MRRVLLGFKHRMVPIPWFLFIRVLKRGAKKTKRVLGGLDDEHRRVHHFVVKKLPDKRSLKYYCRRFCFVLFLSTIFFFSAIPTYMFKLNFRSTSWKEKS